MENLILPLSLLLLIYVFYINRKGIYYIQEEYPSAPVSNLLPHWYTIKSCTTNCIKYTGPFVFSNFIKGEVVCDESGEKYEVCELTNKKPEENIINVSKTIEWKCKTQ